MRSLLCLSRHYWVSRDSFRLPGICNGNEKMRTENVAEYSFEEKGLIFSRFGENGKLKLLIQESEQTPSCINTHTHTHTNTEREKTCNKKPCNLDSTYIFKLLLFSFFHQQNSFVSILNLSKH